MQIETKFKFGEAVLCSQSTCQFADDPAFLAVARAEIDACLQKLTETYFDEYQKLKVELGDEVFYVTRKEASRLLEGANVQH